MRPFSLSNNQHPIPASLKFVVNRHRISSTSNLLQMPAYWIEMRRWFSSKGQHGKDADLFCYSEHFLNGLTMKLWRQVF